MTAIAAVLRARRHGERARGQNGVLVPWTALACWFTEARQLLEREEDGGGVRPAAAVVRRLRSPR